VIGPTPRGVKGDKDVKVEVLGLYAVLSGARAQPLVGDDIDVRIMRMDADEGRIFVSERLAANGQLPLI
jgi:hypothetical protein